jgi:hypothetical protein
MSKNCKRIALLAGVFFFYAGVASAEESFGGWMVSTDGFKGIEVAPVEHKQYREECGSCHFAYQPGWLPARSWKKLLTKDALHNHFGSAADLDAETLDAIRQYALSNASDVSYHKISRKVNAELGEGDMPLRITELRYIKNKHDEIPEKMIRGNKDVKLLSNCNACHTKAEKGIFKESTVSIPNYPNYH